MLYLDMLLLFVVVFFFSEDHCDGASFLCHEDAGTSSMTSTCEFPTPTVSSRAKDSKTTVIDDPNTDRLIAIESARLEVEK